METQSVLHHTAHAGSFRGVSVQAGVATSADLSLVTREGDRVRISFGSEQFAAGSRTQTRRTEGAVMQQLSLTAIAASRYSISIEGDLNEDELKAIQKLTELIDPLAGDFFAGRELNLSEAATALAGNLGEVSELALTLEKTVFASASAVQASQTPQGQGAAGGVPEKNPSGFENIRDFPALVESVVESVFSKHAAGILDQVHLIRKFGDFIEFLKGRLQSSPDSETEASPSGPPGSPSSHETVA